MAENRSKSEQYLLRMPPGLRERIKRHADYNKRSMNTEIIELIESGLYEADVSLMEQGLEPLREMTDTDRRLVASGKRVLASIEARKRENASLDDGVPLFEDEDAALAFGQPPKTDPRATVPSISVELFDQLFGGSRLAAEVEKLREDLAKTIEEVRKTRLTEAEKEDIWQYLQSREKPENPRE